jgi:hypothetical protein
MKKLIPFVAGVAGLLLGCQPAPTTTATPAADVAAGATAPAAGPVAGTEAGARSALRQYLTGQPNAALYVLDSASFVEVDAQWQVLVPRTDWAGRMPNRAAFEVDKLTGEVRPLKVK